VCHQMTHGEGGGQPKCHVTLFDTFCTKLHHREHWKHIVLWNEKCHATGKSGGRGAVGGGVENISPNVT